MMPGTLRRAACALATVLVVAACGGNDADDGMAGDTTAMQPSTTLSVSGVELGKSVGADERVAMPMTTFAPSDTVYASIATDGAPPSATLTAVWTFMQDGERARVESYSRTINPGGPASTAFFISRPDGWPTGQYEVETFADGRSVETRQFQVQ